MPSAVIEVKQKLTVYSEEELPTSVSALLQFMGNGKHKEIVMTPISVEGVKMRGRLIEVRNGDKVIDFTGDDNEAS